MKEQHILWPIDLSKRQDIDDVFIDSDISTGLVWHPTESNINCWTVVSDQE